MKIIFTICLSVFVLFPTTGQTIAAFSGTSKPETATVENLSAEALTRGPGLTVGGGDTFNSGNWSTGASLSTNHYIQWSISAADGFIIHINKFQINFDRDPDGFSQFVAGNGPAQIRIRTSLDNFKSDIYSNSKVKNSGLSPIVETNLNSAPGGTITFRLYGFAATSGLVGPLGTFDIEGGLGKVLGLDNTGIQLLGKVTYDGLLYSHGKWSPNPPNANTSEQNAMILNGTYSEANNVQTKDLVVQPGAGLIIQKTGAITVNGNLTTSNNVVLQSDSENYSSLIVTDTVIGTATYQRQVNIETSLSATGHNILISAPVTEEPFNVFRAANPNIVSNTAKTLVLFGPLNKLKGTYSTYSNTEKAPLTAGTGYRTATIKNGLLKFNGVVNTETITKKILNSGPTHTAWNLIGNPYPSYMDLSEFLARNNSQFAPELAGIYSFDGASSNEYTIRNLAYLTLHPKSKLMPGEGFLVASKTDGGDVTFTPKMRSVGSSNNFSVIKNKIDKHVGFLRLNLTNGISNYNTDFYFNDYSTPGLDPGYDAGIYEGKAPGFAIYSHLTDHSTTTDMAIQSLSYADLSDDLIVPIGINAPAGERLTVRVTESLLPEETHLYLEDKLTHSFTLLNTDDYTIYLDSNISGTGRFFLHVIKSTLSYGSNGADDIRIFTTNDGHNLYIKGAIKQNTVVTVFDLQERLLISTQLDANTTNNQVDVSVLSNGMYIVKLRTGTLEKIKIILLN
ncbi:T9SS type A sorting domain-containing protein [Gelidibacter mesophilus]|uniref:T9SS type A sorting domain-containing protein n=1 Tax=Gelidibacter mesophilus TaxID=169050 RepID=UPI000422F3D8|nr:T9SS type A sorting domain-containing protein [Gelidibacter mesophilus]